MFYIYSLEKGFKLIAAATAETATVPHLYHSLPSLIIVSFLHNKILSQGSIELLQSKFTNVRNRLEGLSQAGLSSLV
jgi:hypothetical protein